MRALHRTTSVAALVAAVLAIAVLGCGDGDPASTAPPDDGAAEEATRLEITLWPQGRDGPSRSETVVCAHDEDEAQGCAAAARVDPEALAPTPPDAACTQIYGGPQEARIEGTLRGEEIDAELNRVNGCEIDRWESAAPLLEVAEQG